MSVARITAFNNLLRNIVDIVATKFPEDRDIEWYRSRIELSTSVSPRQTIISFMQTAQPYLKNILQKDEQFFLCVADSQQSLQKLGLGEKWDKLEGHEKDALWKNVQKMVLLGNKILQG
jgi:hypothetical protein